MQPRCQRSHSVRRRTDRAKAALKVSCRSPDVLGRAITAETHIWQPRPDNNSSGPIISSMRRVKVGHCLRARTKGVGRANQSGPRSGQPLCLLARPTERNLAPNAGQACRSSRGGRSNQNPAIPPPRKRPATLGLRSGGAWPQGATKQTNARLVPKTLRRMLRHGDGEASRRWFAANKVQSCSCAADSRSNAENRSCAASDRSNAESRSCETDDRSSAESRGRPLRCEETHLRNGRPLGPLCCEGGWPLDPHVCDCGFTAWA